MTFIFYEQTILFYPSYLPLTIILFPDTNATFICSQLIIGLFIVGMNS